MKNSVSKRYLAIIGLELNNCKSLKRNSRETNVSLKFSLSFLFILTALLSYGGGILSSNLLHQTSKEDFIDMQVIECGSDITPIGSITGELKGTSIKFQMQIKNTGISINSFTISANDYSEFDENPDGSSTEKNIKLEQKLEDDNKNEISGAVTLAPGETYTFYVKLTYPQNEKHKTWNGTRITATSSSCPDNISSIIVHTYIPLPDGIIIGINQDLSPPFHTTKEFKSRDYSFPGFSLLSYKNRLA